MKKPLLVASALVLAFSSLGVISPKAYATAQTCTWTGGGSDSKFSTAANWSNCNSSVPQAGDIIRFATLLSSNVTLTNDLGVDLGGVISVAQSDSSGKSGVYTLSALSLVDGAAITIEKASTCDPNYPMIGVSTLVGKGALSVDQRVFYGATPVATVTGALTLTSGNGFNTFASGSTVSSIVMATGVDVTTATGCSGSGALVPGHDDFANFSYNSLAVQKGARVSLVSYSKPMTLGGGSGSVNPIVNFYSADDGSAVTYTWSSAITLLGDATVNPDSKVTVNYTGAITGSGLSLTKSLYALGTFNFNPSSNNTASQTGTQLNPVKTTQLDGTTTDRVDIVDRETGVLNGTRNSIAVYPGGLLKGSGTLTSWLSVNEGATVAPGNSPGCITSDTLYLAGEYQFELGGADPCDGYDQLKVLNASNSSPAVSFDSTSAILTTSRYNGYTPEQGDEFVIIDQAGDKAVSGTFKDLPEGATFTQNGIVFKISYVGGDGNDVTLTVQNSPTAPDTGVQLLKANPALIAVGTVIAFLALLGLARRAKQQR